jgi:hypothetical protein
MSGYFIELLSGITITRQSYGNISDGGTEKGVNHRVSDPDADLRGACRRVPDLYAPPPYTGFISTTLSNANPLAASPRPVCLRTPSHTQGRPSRQRVRW